MVKINETQVPITRKEREFGGPVTWVRPFGLVHKLAEEMDRMVENFGITRGFFPAVTRELEEVNWIPKVEVFERKGYLVVRTDLPGLRAEDVKVEVTPEMLTIEGERKREEEEEGERYYRTERWYGNFYRAIPLPEGVNPETAKATFNNGVLEVTLLVPPVREERARKVEVEEAPPRAGAKAA